MQGETLKFVNE